MAMDAMLYNKDYYSCQKGKPEFSMKVWLMMVVSVERNGQSATSLLLGNI